MANLIELIKKAEEKNLTVRFELDNDIMSKMKGEIEIVYKYVVENQFGKVFSNSNFDKVISYLNHQC